MYRPRTSEFGSWPSGPRSRVRRFFMPGFMGGGGGARVSNPVQNALRLRRTNTAYLTRTPGAAGNRRVWTFSVWLKRGSLGTSQQIIGQGSGIAGGGAALYFSSDDTLRIYSGGTDYKITSAKYRDVSAWMHIVWAMDATNSITRLYVNGVEPAYSTNSNPSNSDQSFNSTTAHSIGANTSGTYAFDGLIARPELVDALYLDASFFARTDAATGQWVPKAYSGSYATSGFCLKFADTSGNTAATIGKDSSVNGNNWTPSGIDVTTAGVTNDASVDLPTSTCCTWSTLSNQDASVISWANMRATGSGAAARAVVGDMALDATTKVYVEFDVTTYYNVNYPMIGMFSVDHVKPTGSIATAGAGVRGFMFYPIAANGGYINFDGAQTTFTRAISYTASGKNVGIAFDPATGNGWVRVDGSWDGGGDPAAGTSPTFTASNLIGHRLTPAISTYDSSVVDLNCGQRPFAYAAPTGFKAIHTGNLPAPTDKKSETGFAVRLRAGSNSPVSVADLLFGTNLTLLTKSYSTADNWNIADSVRGTSKNLQPNVTNAEDTLGCVTSFDANGYTLGGAFGRTNASGQSFVDYVWRIGAQYGHDVQLYTGNGSNRTISHNLGVVPHMIWVKGRSGAVGGAQNWRVYHRNSNASPQNGGVYLSLSNGFTTDSTWWNNTAPTSSVFSLGTDSGVNHSDGTFVAYLWTEIPGLSRIGSYIGNSSSDGVRVDCGFRPAFVMIKSLAAAADWCVYDDLRLGYNPDNNLQRIVAAAQQTDDDIDFLSNGFKLRRSSTNFNNSGTTFIFAAFARAPFKYANAR